MSTETPKTGSSEPAGTWGEGDVIEVIPRITSFVFSKIGKEHGEDVVQETLLAICKGLSRARAKTKREFLSWALGIAYNKIIDALRGKYSEPSEPLDDLLQNTLQTLEGELPPGTFEDARLLLNLIQQSKYPCNTILVDYLLHDLEHDEIAAIYELSSPDAARMKIKRCLEAVRNLLKKKERL